MIYLFTLLFITLTIFYIQRKIWFVEQNILFPVATSIIYLWSLAGSWLFILDQLFLIGNSIGLEYKTLLVKMFPVILDVFYLKSIILYGSFIIIYQIITLFLVKRTTSYQRKKINNYQLKEWKVIAISVGCLLISFFIVKESIIYSILLNESFYLNIRTVNIPYYSIHQYMNWIMVFSLYLYIGLYFIDNKLNVKINKPSLVFWIIFTIVNLYLVIIGTRHEVFSIGVMCLLLIVLPNGNFRYNWKKYLILGFVWFFILMLNDPMRSLMPTITDTLGVKKLLSRSENLESAEFYKNDRTFVIHHSKEKSFQIINSINPLDTMIVIHYDTLIVKKTYLKEQLAISDSIIYKGEKYKVGNHFVSNAYKGDSFTNKIVNAVTNVLFSNELFAGHFSMYGVLKKNVQSNPELAFKSLMNSFLPSFIRYDDVDDLYSYYAKSMEFKSKQGFTINHITSWYLTLSYYGIFVGAFVVSLIIFLPFYLYKKHQLLVSLVVCCAIISFMSIVIRSGIEVYKALLYESVIIPILILFLIKNKIKTENE